VTVRLILAHARDEPARALARRWGGDALLLTPGDLRRSRWRLDVDHRGAARATLGDDGRATQIEAVVSRLGGISGVELPRVRPQDRDYAAAELTAFLLAWLDACPCPVLNPPVAGSLNGPPWHPEHWAAAATRVGLVVRAVRRCVAPGQLAAPDAAGPATGVGATVVAGRCLGAVHPLLGRRLCALAAAAGTPLLGATVDGAGAGAAVADLTAWPDVADPEVADALALALEGSDC
jgi:hypothetical protein